MKIFFDTEFTGLHKDTTLISIGMIDEDNNSFYAEFTDYDDKQCDSWIKENVISHLNYNGTRGHLNLWGRRPLEKLTYAVGNKKFIKDKIRDWLSCCNEVELVSDVCHYDMVLFIDIFGSAWDLPRQINPACHDINQDIANYYHISETEAFDESREGIINEFNITIEGDKHNSLYDAKVIKTIYEQFYQNQIF